MTTRWLPGGRRIAALFGALALVLTATPALADGVTGNFMRADAVTQPARIGLYDYTSGTFETWTDATDYTAGTIVDLSTGAVPGSLTLDPIGPTGVTIPDTSIVWWDKNWNTRICYLIDHTAAGAQTVTEYQVRLELDLGQLVTDGYLQADGGDLRAVAADGATQLDMWVEGPLTSSQGAIWVQVDAITAASSTHFCLYYGYSAGIAAPLANHTEAAVFTHSTRKPVYYAVNGRYTTAPSSLAVVSYVAGNQVQRNAAAPVALGAGGRAAFGAAGNTPATIFSVLGPISGRGTGQGYDTLAPISWAGTRFVVPTTRGAQRFSFYSPFAAANVTIANGAAAPYAAFVVPAGGAYTHYAGDVTGSNAAIITSSAPILVHHYATSNRDAIAVYPETDDDLYGVRSTQARIGFGTNGTALTVRRSNGTTQNYVHNLGQSRLIGGGGSQGGGAADAFRLSATAPVGALQQADSDGSESTVFLPGWELGSQYWIPTNSQYVTFACPSQGVGLQVVPPAAAPWAGACAGAGGAGFPGKARQSGNLNVTAGQGILVRSPGGEPFYAYYEDRTRNDETNLLGMKQGRQYTWPEPVLTPSVEGLMRTTSGTWESATLDTGGAGTEVFGEMAWATSSLPAGTTLRFQAATADVDPPAAFFGPDGTAASYFDTLGAVLAFAADGDRYLRIRAYLDTTDPCLTPVLDSVTVAHDLPALAPAVGTPATLAITGTIGGSTRHNLVRARTWDAGLAGSQTQLRYLSGAGLGNTVDVELLLVNVPQGLNSSQLALAGGPPAPTAGPLVGFDASAPHSVVIDEEMLAGGATIDVSWRTYDGGAASPFIERDLSIVISS